MKNIENSLEIAKAIYKSVLINCNNSGLEDKVFELITELSSINSKSKESNFNKQGKSL